ncbi:hypothetical protein SAMD00019534_033600 [Acytostelium subglobosum LB1]|uniref:hypothetical protein n=1 Tax=Acytostelium subglobosum LB1 TaxID=1410327 RepID=UPI000644D0F1|nr:hypothetical protein SAMD00019534_033600 [Acytostelium subglobosum LB1]GAM20185.1 hypothetical protein SAMD00019534_033600 [Acytostelium subglobosum LB1]|eukprot:XP_012759706.1 hypothetical protein SAMD00019534_033600 [Acytostelium subglobosum LB1]
MSTSTATATTTMLNDSDIDELERRVEAMELALLSYQPLAQDPVLRAPLPGQLTLQQQQQLMQHQQQSSPLLTRKKQAALNAAHPQETLVDQLDRFRSTLNLIKTDNEAISQFMSFYKENETLFNSIVESDELLEPVEKLAIILSSEDELIQTARSLQLVSELEKFINQPSTTGDIPANINKLQPIELQHHEQQAIAIALNKKLEERIQSYNEIVQSLSMKFALWNSILSPK